eukprot:SAG11_NODE_13351_length_659_cov_0.733929_1_plen_49_part_10
MPLLSMFEPREDCPLAESLNEYLTRGGIDMSKWDEDALGQLGSEVSKGE